MRRPKFKKLPMVTTKIFGLKGQLTNCVAYANTHEGPFSETAPRCGTAKTIKRVKQVPVPRTFTPGTASDYPRCGLNSTQREMVQGVDAPTKFRAPNLSLVRTTYIWEWQQLMIRSYCNCGAKSAVCIGGVAISRLLLKDGREIPCLCIL